MFSAVLRFFIFFCICSSVVLDKDLWTVKCLGRSLVGFINISSWGYLSEHRFLSRMIFWISYYYPPLFVLETSFRLDMKQNTNHPALLYRLFVYWFSRKNAWKSNPHCFCLRSARAISYVKLCAKNQTARAPYRFIVHLSGCPRPCRPSPSFPPVPTSSRSRQQQKKLVSTTICVRWWKITRTFSHCANS